MKNLPRLSTPELVGTPIYWAGSELPSDDYVWVLGQSFDKNVHVELAKIYPTGRLPDPRWDFFRVVGTDQKALERHGQSVQPLTFRGNALPGHSHTSSGGYQGGWSTNVNADAKNTNNAYRPRTDSVSAGTPTGTISGTGSETRPRNMYWYCIMRIK